MSVSSFHLRAKLFHIHVLVAWLSEVISWGTGAGWGDLRAGEINVRPS